MVSQRIAVISGRYPESTFGSSINHKAYCCQHGYTYIYCNWPTDAGNPYMNKIRYIQEYYAGFDYIFWIDDDAFFMDHSVGLEGFIPKNDDFLSICCSPDFKNIKTFVSSGTFMLKCSELGRCFIDSIYSVDLSMVRAWWPPSLGYFSNGDQDAMIFLMMSDSRFSGFSRYHYSRFNSRVENLLNNDPVFVLHFTGSMAVKTANLRRVQLFLRCGRSLLPGSLEQTLRISYVDRRRLFSTRLISWLRRLF